jgi:hypothetical protein
MVVRAWRGYAATAETQAYPEHLLQSVRPKFEAAGAVVAWVLRQPRVTSVSATVPDENLPSQRLAAKLGLVRGETRRDLPLWRTTEQATRS